MNKCRDCKHWGEHVERPWAGSIGGPSPRRAAEQKDERDCVRMGGFASSGGFGKFPHFVDGDHMPRNEAYLMAYDANGRLVTCPDFGCALWEAKCSA